MKTKINIIVVSLLFLLCGSNVSAQNIFYIYTGTIVRSDFTYQCINKGGWITLYNINNQLTDIRRTNKDGSKLTDSKIRDGIVSTIEFEEAMQNQMKSIVNAGFSKFIKFGTGNTGLTSSKMRGLKLYVDIKFNSDTGRVIDVSFFFDATTALGTVDPSTFYEIEQNFKNNFCVTVAPAGKKLSHVTCGLIIVIQ